ncbi:hypothetical protein BDV18DRAFT_49944 [Aspergillus unguis]
MTTFETPLYSFPSSSLPGTLWTNWKIEASPISTYDDEDFRFDPSWELPVYPLPDYYCDEWSDQSTTPISSLSPFENPVPMPQISDNGVDVPYLVTPLDTYTPAPPFTPIAPSPTHELPSESGSVSNRTSISSGTTTPTDHSSPSDSCSTHPPVRTARRRRTARAKGPIQCWEHSCEGRAFSSLGNYERHLREKTGKAKSFQCEKCGQRFTRSTAKNKHIKFGRCRGRPTQTK